MRGLEVGKRLVRVLDYRLAYEESLKNFTKYLEDLGLSYEVTWSTTEYDWVGGMLLEAFNCTDWSLHTDVSITTHHDEFHFIRSVIRYCKMNYGIVPYIKFSEYSGDIESYIKCYVDEGIIEYEP